MLESGPDDLPSGPFVYGGAAVMVRHVSHISILKLFEKAE
jgi:hypothetical protein